jgi:hypothetical protein
VHRLVEPEELLHLTDPLRGGGLAGRDGAGFAGTRKKMTYVTNVTAMNNTTAQRRRRMR